MLLSHVLKTVWIIRFLLLLNWLAYIFLRFTLQFRCGFLIFFEQRPSLPFRTFITVNNIRLWPNLITIVLPAVDFRFTLWFIGSLGLINFCALQFSFQKWPSGSIRILLIILVLIIIWTVWYGIIIWVQVHFLLLSLSHLFFYVHHAIISKIYRADQNFMPISRTLLRNIFLFIVFLLFYCRSWVVLLSFFQQCFLFCIYFSLLLLTFWILNSAFITLLGIIFFGWRCPNCWHVTVLFFHFLLLLNCLFYHFFKVVASRDFLSRARLIWKFSNWSRWWRSMDFHMFYFL